MVGTCFDSKKRKVILSSHCIQGTSIGILTLNPHGSLRSGEGYSHLYMGLKAQRIETLAYCSISN